MSTLAFAGDATRGLAIAGAATLAARALHAVVHRRPAIVALAAWAMMPALAVAYAWAALPCAALHRPIAAQGLHLALAALRLAPVALVVAACAPPPPLGAAAWHCLRLAGRRGTATGRSARAWSWWSSGPGRRWLLAALAVFPAAFAEFELGSRLDVGVWAVRLFDAQAGGQGLGATLLQAAPGIAVQVAALAAAWLLARRRGLGAEPSAGPGADPRWLRACAWTLLGAGSAALVLVPLATVAAEAGGGTAAALAQAGNLRGELAASVVFAAAAAACAWLAAGVAIHPRASAPARVLGAGAAAIGLCGSLVVGLAVLAICQLPPLRTLADTPLPLVVALAALLLPYAALLRLLIDARRELPGWHAAALLAAGDPDRRRAAGGLRWRLADGKRWWAGALLFLWAYCDLAASAILHPVDMTPVLVRLYNLMHYGHSTALSVQLVLALLAPALALALAWAALRLLPRLQRLPRGDGARPHG